MFLLRTPLGVSNAALLIGLLLYPASFIAIKLINETHGRDLNYLEMAGS